MASGGEFMAAAVPMKKRIAVILSTRPENGGAFQYALSMLGALGALDP